MRNHVQPYIPSILEALMVPTSQGFTEVRDVFFKEVTDMNLNVINEGGIDKLGEVRLGCQCPQAGGQRENGCWGLEHEAKGQGGDGCHLLVSKPGGLLG